MFAIISATLISLAAATNSTMAYEFNSMCTEAIYNDGKNYAMSLTQLDCN